MITLLLGILARVRRDEVSLLLVAPFWLGRVWFSELISLLDSSPWEIPLGRDLLSQAGVYHPAQSWGSCGCGPWGGTANSFRSLSWGCWDHPPIQSSLYEETACPEVETLHFMMWRPPAWPSQLPNWYISGFLNCMCPAVLILQAFFI